MPAAGPSAADAGVRFAGPRDMQQDVPGGEDDEEASVPLLASGEAGEEEATAVQRAKRLKYGDAEDAVEALEQMSEFLYGGVPPPQTRSLIGALAATLAILIGGFWLLDSVKDSIFVGTVGLRYLPYAKPVSVAVSLCAVLGYTRLTEVLSAAQLFGFVGAAFCVLFAALGLWLAVPGEGPGADRPHAADRMIGWVCYCAIESFGSVAVALFWAFTNDRVDLETAKSSYGIIIAVAQVGAILGASIATYSRSLHSYGILALGALAPLAASALLRKIAAAVPGADAAPLGSASAAPDGGGGGGGAFGGVFGGAFGGVLRAAGSGLRLVARDGYVLGLLLVSSVSEVVLTVLDFQLKAMGAEETGAASGTEGGADGMTSFMARFGQLANVVSLSMSLLGTSLLVRSLGVGRALQLFPAALTFVVALTALAAGTDGMLPLLFQGVAALKGLTYALHEPLKEMLYKPTSQEVKFKARAWIDVFASRGAKAIGAAVNAMAGPRSAGAGALAARAFCLAVALALMALARAMGREFDLRMRGLQEKEGEGEWGGAGEDEAGGGDGDGDADGDADGGAGGRPGAAEEEGGEVEMASV